MADPEGFRIASAWIEVEPNADDFQEKLQAALDEAVAGVHADVSVGLDKSGVDAGADDAKAKVAELDDLRAEIEIAANDDDLRAKADDAKAKRDELDGSVAEIEIAGNTDDWDAKSDEARAERDELDGTSATIAIKGDDSEFLAMAARDKAEASGGGGESGSLIGALSLGVGSLMPGIGGAAAGMGLLAGTGALAFGGVAKALEAHSAAASTAGTTSAQLASTAFSNAVAIQQAQQGVQQAYEQSAQASSSSAAQVESAQMSAAEAVRSAAQSQAQALQAVTQAEQQEQQASFGLGQAQYNLTAAWIQARYSLEQLNDSERDSATTIKAARLAVEQAQYQQQLTDQNAMSTSLDRQQAAIAVTQAQEALTAAQQQATYTSREANLQDKAGVAGSQTVLSAKEAVRQAVEAVRNAEVQAADAQRNLTDTELNNADQIKQAQLGVSQAEQEAAYSQQQSAQSVRTALRNVTDAMKEQRLAAAATASTSNKAASQYQQDLAKLSPAARTFVGQLLGMHGALHALEGDAQAAVLPGVSSFFRDIKGDLPIVAHGVTEMGHAMSSSFAGFGKLAETPAFKSGLTGLLANGVEFAKVVLPAFATFLQQLGAVGGQKGAVTGLADGLAGLGHGLTGLVTGMKPYIPLLNQLFSVVGKFLADMGPALAQTLGGVLDALHPLLAFLNSKAGAPVLRTLAGFATSMLAVKGIAKLLPGELGKSFGKIPGVIAKPLGAAGKGMLKAGWRWGKDIGGRFLGSLKGAAQGAWGAMEGPLGTAGGTVARWGSQFAGTMATAAGSVARFAETQATNLASAAGATVEWIAEHTVAAATFISENAAMAVSATAAFIAENAATLGIGAAIAVLVGGIVYMATHWHQTWDAVKDVAEDAWKFLTTGWGKYLFPEIDLIKDAVTFLGDHWSAIWGTIQSVSEDVWQDGLQPVFKGIETGAEFLYNDAIHPYFQLMMDEFHLVEDAALFMWHEVFDPLWRGIETGASDFVHGFETAWGRLESVFKTPVNFLIKTVYDNGIRKMWDEVVEHIGLGSLKLPVIPAMAAGGITPGRDTGRDSMLVAMRPEEGVLVPEAVKGLGGPGFVHAANAHFGGHAPGPSAGPVPGFARGGVLGDVWHGITGIGHGLLDSAKWAAELAADPGKAVTELLGKTIGTSATGDLGKVMEAIPRTIIGDLAKAITGASASGGGGGSGGGPLPAGTGGGIGNLPDNWKAIATYLAAHGFSKYAAAGVAGNIEAESHGDPEILEIGGGGGGGLIQWTPYPPSYITGDYFGDLQRQLYAITQWGGGPSLVNRATSPSNAALLYQDYYERPESLTASLPIRMASANAVYQAMGWGRHDDGGMLMPMGMPGGMPGVNTTGQPERVLTPQQTEAFDRLVQRLTQTDPSNAGTGVTVNQNYFGPQMPSPEMQAQQRRDLAMLLGGG